MKTNIDIDVPGLKPALPHIYVGLKSQFILVIVDRLIKLCIAIKEVGFAIEKIRKTPLGKLKRVQLPRIILEEHLKLHVVQMIDGT